MDWLEDFDPFHAALVAFLFRFEREMTSRWERLESEAVTAILGSASGQKKHSLFTHFFEDSRQQVAAGVHARFPSLLNVATSGRNCLKNQSPLAWTRAQIWIELCNFLGIDETFDHAAPPRADNRLLRTALHLSGEGETPPNELSRTLPKWAETGWGLSRLLGLCDAELAPRDKEPMSPAETLQWVKSQEFWMHRRLEKQIEDDMYDGIIAAGGAGVSVLTPFPSDNLTNLQLSTVQEPEPIGSNQENQFFRDGDKWTIRYAGETCRLRPMLGLDYIATLLQHAGKALRALEVQSLVSGVPEAGPRPRPAGSESEVIHDENSSNGSDRDNARRNRADSSDDLVDDTAIRNLKHNLLELEEQIAARHSIGDTQKASELEKRHFQIESYLKNSLNFRGRSRRFSDDNERARQSITKALDRAYESIQDAAPRTAEHLKAQITSGAQFMYRDTVTLWQIRRKA